jgi:hypothetical protein
VGLFRLTPRPRLPISVSGDVFPCSLAKGGCRLARLQDVSNPWFALGKVTRSKRSASVQSADAARLMSAKGQLLTLRRSIELVRFVPESGRVIYFLRGIWMGGLIITTLKSSPILSRKALQLRRRSPNAAQAEAI